MAEPPEKTDLTPSIWPFYSWPVVLVTLSLIHISEPTRPY